MTATSAPVIIVEPLGPLRVGVVPWAHQRPVGPARHFLTVVAKVTLTRVHRGDCRIVTPEPLSDADRSPLLPRGEVTLTGTSPAVGQSVLVHLRVSRDGQELGMRRSSIEVVGSIAELSALGARAPEAPERTALLRGAAPPRMEDGVVVVPSGLDASYFQTAPLDQRFDGLRGDELIEIDGLGDPAATIGFRLPRLHATAYVYNLAPQPTHVALAVDTVRVELPSERVTVVMRGNCAVGSRQSFDGLGVAARLESPVKGPVFPVTLGPRRVASTPPANNLTMQLVQTAQLDEPLLPRSPLPFDPSAVRAIPAPRPAPEPVRVTAADEGPMSAAPMTLAPHTARIDGAAPAAAPLPFVHSGGEPAPKSRRAPRTKTKPEAAAPPASSKRSARAASTWAKGAGASAELAPLPPARVASPAFVAAPPPLVTQVVDEDVAPSPSPDDRGRGLLARGRGADFLRALRAADDDERT